MEYKTNTTLLIQGLKSELKKSKVSYKDLAKELKITEAGVKKLFTRSNMSLDRAFEICKVLNLPLAELLSRLSGAEQNELRFSGKQTDFFRKNIHFFHFYMKLAYEQKTPLQIQEEHHLSLKSLNGYLKKLEDLGLIRRHPKDRAQIIGGTPLAVTTQGTTLEQVKFDIMEGLLKGLKETNAGTLAGASLLITSQEAEELKSKWSELLRDYSFLSNRNRKNRKRDASSVSLMLVQVPVSMFNEIREI